MSHGSDAYYWFEESLNENKFPDLEVFLDEFYKRFAVDTRDMLNKFTMTSL